MTTFFTKWHGFGYQLGIHLFNIWINGMLGCWDIGPIQNDPKLDFFLQSAYGSCIQSVSYNTGVNCDKWAYLLLSAQKFTFNRTSWQPVESLRVVLTDIDWWQCVGMSACINSTAVVCKRVPPSHEPRCEKGCGSLSEVSGETIRQGLTLC